MSNLSINVDWITGVQTPSKIIFESTTVIASPFSVRQGMLKKSGMRIHQQRR